MTSAIMKVSDRTHAIKSFRLARLSMSGLVLLSWQWRSKIQVPMYLFRRYLIQPLNHCIDSYWCLKLFLVQSEGSIFKIFEQIYFSKSEL